MQQCGIYEQLITQLLTSRLDRERFYVGERQLEPAEAAVWLSRFLSRVLEYAVGSVTGEDQLQRQIELANQYSAQSVPQAFANDILIGHTSNTDLMASIPIEADEIEALMAGSA